jgi:hypothetical protein
MAPPSQLARLKTSLACKNHQPGELHRERERLGLPRLGKHRLAFVSRQPRQRLEALGF